MSAFYLQSGWQLNFRLGIRNKASILPLHNKKQPYLTTNEIIFQLLVACFKNLDKGQLISKCLLVSPNRPKNQQNFCKDFCPSLLKEVKSKK